MLESGDRVIIGVSGGPDSVALLYLLLSLRDKYDLSLKIAHLNHKLRGEESEQDAAYVEKLAQSLDLPYRIEAREVSSLAKKERLSLEEAARKVRYSFLYEITDDFRADKIALGHNLDDQIETFLLWMIRGAGLDGLRGIPPSRDKIIRPLLETPRSDIEAYLKERGIYWRVDRSNEEFDYLRNRIRGELIPLLASSYNPNIRDTINRSLISIRDDLDFIEREVEAELPHLISRKDKGEIAIDLFQLSSYHIALQRRVIRALIRHLKGDLREITFGHIEDILRLAVEGRSGAELNLPYGIVVHRSYQELILSLRGVIKISPKVYRKLAIPGITGIPEWSLEVEAHLLKPDEVDSYCKGREEVCLDYDKIEGDIVIRNRLPGDKFSPIGLKGTKKIKDLFIEAKIPREKRGYIPLIATEKMIIWVVGGRIDERVKITSETEHILHLKVKGALLYL